MNHYLNLTPEEVQDIYMSIHWDVIKDMHDKYKAHIRTAAKRGILMELTREEWCALWWASCSWHQRGREGNDFQMCRKDDIGSYSMGNVRIDTQRANIEDRRDVSKRKPFIAKRITTGEEFYCEKLDCDQVKSLGLNKGNVSSCLNGHKTEYKGFTFRYA